MQMTEFANLKNFPGVGTRGQGEDEHWIFGNNVVGGFISFGLIERCELPVRHGRLNRHGCLLQ